MLAEPLGAFQVLCSDVVCVPGELKHLQISELLVFLLDHFSMSSWLTGIIACVLTAMCLALSN